jgi:O-antigen/teichoic acid export membrane protein
VSAITILRNMSYLTMGRVVGDLVTFALFVVMTRAFGQEGIGRYSFGMALTSFSLVITDFGLAYYAIRELSRDPRDLATQFSRMQTARLALLVPVGIVFFVVISLLDQPSATRTVAYTLGAYHLVYALVGGYISVFVSQENMRAAGLAEIGARGGAAVIALGLIASGASLERALLAFPIATALVAVALHLAVAHRWGPVRYPRLDAVSGAEVRRLLRESASFGFMDLLQHLATRIDVVFLGVLVGTVAAGVYNTAYRVVVFPQLLSYFAAISLLPLASRLAVDAPDKLRTLYSDSLKTAVFVALPAAVGLALIAPELVEFCFSAAFTASGPILRVLSCLVFLFIVKQVLGVFLMATNRQPRNLAIQFSAAVLNGGGNALLIPYYGVMGAAWMSIVSEALAVILLAYALHGPLGWPPVAGRLVIAALGTGAFVIVAALLPGLPWPLLIPVAVVVYAAVVSLVPDVRRREWGAIRGWREKIDTANQPSR